VLQQFVDHGSLTMNTVVQGAWAILLSRYSGQQDVLYGAVKSCRRSSVPGADRMLGPLLTTLPLPAEVRGPLTPDAGRRTVRVPLENGETITVGPDL